MSLCEVISTTEKGFCMHKITTVYLMAENYLTPTQFNSMCFEIIWIYKDWGIAIWERQRATTRSPNGEITVRKKR